MMTRNSSRGQSGSSSQSSSSDGGWSECIPNRALIMVSILLLAWSTPIVVKLGMMINNGESIPQGLFPMLVLMVLSIIGMYISTEYSDQE